MKKREKNEGTYTNEQIPKAVHVENAATILSITFDNGEKRYLRSHFNTDYVDAFSPSRGKGKRALLLTSPFANWAGTTVEIKEDGGVIINEKDHYSPQELWYKSKASINEL